SPGVMKCGWPSTRAVASVMDSASSTEYPEIWLSLSATPAEVTFLAPPTGDPMSTMASPALPAHAIHASIPAFICSGVEFDMSSSDETVDRYRTMNFAIRRLLSDCAG